MIAPVQENVDAPENRPIVLRVLFSCALSVRSLLELGCIIWIFRSGATYGSEQASPPWISCPVDVTAPEDWLRAFQSYGSSVMTWRHTACLGMRSVMKNKGDGDGCQNKGVIQRGISDVC